MMFNRHRNVTSVPATSKIAATAKDDGDDVHSEKYFIPIAGRLTRNRTTVTTTIPMTKLIATTAATTTAATSPSFSSLSQRMRRGVTIRSSSTTTTTTTTSRTKKKPTRGPHQHKAMASKEDESRVATAVKTRPRKGSRRCSNISSTPTPTKMTPAVVRNRTVDPTTGIAAGAWNKNECLTFLQSLKRHGHGRWKDIATDIPTRYVYKSVV
jgi:hypothetical protein